MRPRCRYMHRYRTAAPISPEISGLSFVQNMKYQTIYTLEQHNVRWRPVAGGVFPTREKAELAMQARHNMPGTRTLRITVTHTPQRTLHV